jgi:hypothetical protein
MQTGLLSLFGHSASEIVIFETLDHKRPQPQ